MQGKLQDDLEETFSAFNPVCHSQQLLQNLRVKSQVTEIEIELVT